MSNTPFNSNHSFLQNNVYHACQAGNVDPLPETLAKVGGASTIVYGVAKFVAAHGAIHVTAGLVLSSFGFVYLGMAAGALVGCAIVEIKEKLT